MKWLKLVVTIYFYILLLVLLSRRVLRLYVNFATLGFERWSPSKYIQMTLINVFGHKMIIWPDGNKQTRSQCIGWRYLKSYYPKSEQYWPLSRLCLVCELIKKSEINRFLKHGLKQRNYQCICSYSESLEIVFVCLIVWVRESTSPCWKAESSFKLIDCFCLMEVWFQNIWELDSQTTWRKLFSQSKVKEIHVVLEYTVYY